VTDQTKSTTKGTTKCVYFADGTQVKKLEALLSKFPRATLSAVLAQTLPPILEALEHLPENQRQLAVNMKIWI